MKYITILFMFLPFIASAGIEQVPCGSEWINIHSKNPDLLGIHVQQLPDNLADQNAYKNKHPAIVVFIFKGNKAHQISYTPSGQVESGFWWRIPEGHKILNNINTNLKENIICGFWVK